MGKIDLLIGDAIKAAENHLAEGGVIPKAYGGYIASFGTSIMQCGLLPAVALFSQSKKNTNSQEDPSKVIKVVYQLIKRDGWKPTLLEEAISYQDNRQKLEELGELVMDASVALKLAVRTFEIK